MREVKVARVRVPRRGSLASSSSVTAKVQRRTSSTGKKRGKNAPRIDRVLFRSTLSVSCAATVRTSRSRSSTAGTVAIPAMAWSATSGRSGRKTVTEALNAWHGRHTGKSRETAMVIGSTATGRPLLLVAQWRVNPRQTTAFDSA